MPMVLVVRMARSVVVGMARRVARRDGEEGGAEAPWDSPQASPRADSPPADASAPPQDAAPPVDMALVELLGRQQSAVEVSAGSAAGPPSASVSPSLLPCESMTILHSCFARPQSSCELPPGFGSQSTSGQKRSPQTGTPVERRPSQTSTPVRRGTPVSGGGDRPPSGRVVDTPLPCFTSMRRFSSNVDVPLLGEGSDGSYDGSSCSPVTPLAPAARPQRSDSQWTADIRNGTTVGPDAEKGPLGTAGTVQENVRGEPHA